jgi:hypothetical protein
MADLLQVEGNSIEVRPLERYLKLSGIGAVTLRVYEDAMEAIRRLHVALATVIIQRIGGRAYQRIVQTLRDEWFPGIQTEQQARFAFSEFVNQSLSLVEGER